MTIYEYLEFGDNDKEPQWWERELRRIHKKIQNALVVYSRYDSLALRHFNKCVKGIDEKTRQKEYILTAVAYAMLELYKEDFSTKKIGKGILAGTTLFDISDEIYKDIINAYSGSKKELNESIDFAEKLYKKFKDTK